MATSSRKINQAMGDPPSPLQLAGKSAAEDLPMSGRPSLSVKVYNFSFIHGLFLKYGAAIHLRLLQLFLLRFF